MPRYTQTARFRRDFNGLTPEQQARFRAAVVLFIADLRGGRSRRGLRVKGVFGALGIYEMTWAPDGRATFMYGEEGTTGGPHILWRRVGAHHVFRRP